MSRTFLHVFQHLYCFFFFFCSAVFFLLLLSGRKSSRTEWEKKQSHKKKTLTHHVEITNVKRTSIQKWCLIVFLWNFPLRYTIQQFNNQLIHSYVYNHRHTNVQIHSINRKKMEEKKTNKKYRTISYTHRFQMHVISNPPVIHNKVHCITGCYQIDTLILFLFLDCFEFFFSLLIAKFLFLSTSSLLFEREKIKT